MSRRSHHSKNTTGEEVTGTVAEDEERRESSREWRKKGRRQARRMAKSEREVRIRVRVSAESEAGPCSVWFCVAGANTLQSHSVPR